MLFNKQDSGSAELRQLLGFIDASTNFDKWITWLRLSQRQTVSLIGRDLYNRAKEHYKSDNFNSPEMEVEPERTAENLKNDELVNKIQLTIALFAYVKMIPSIDAGHGNAGRIRIVGETERPLTAVEAYKDEQNIQNLAYEALEDLIVYAEEEKFPEWEKAPVKQTAGQLLIPNAATFNLYYPIHSSRLYFTLVPMMQEVQDRYVVPILTRERFEKLKSAMPKKADLTDEETKLIGLLTSVCRPMALMTIKLALERLPIEVFPEGLVQTQIVGTVKEKQIANERTRLSMIQSLTDDAQAGFTSLQMQINELFSPEPTEKYVAPPKAEENIKGFLF